MTSEENFPARAADLTKPPMREEDRDLGFGSVIAGASRQRLLNQDGTFNVQMVNGRSNQLIEVEAQVLFSRFVEDGGKMVRRFDVLELERRVVFFPLAWTVVHPIDDKSLLSNLTEADLKKTDAEILILIAATDETFASVVHTRSSYKTSEIKFKHKFVNMYNEVKDGAPLSIDIKKLSQIEKVEE